MGRSVQALPSGSWYKTTPRVFRSVFVAFWNGHRASAADRSATHHVNSSPPPIRWRSRLQTGSLGVCPVRPSTKPRASIEEHLWKNGFGGWEQMQRASFPGSCKADQKGLQGAAVQQAGLVHTLAAWRQETADTRLTTRLLMLRVSAQQEDHSLDEIGMPVS
jgi:hypothetical protein